MNFKCRASKYFYEVLFVKIFRQQIACVNSIYRILKKRLDIYFKEMFSQSLAKADLSLLIINAN